nr:MAG TPA: hypothetical protein [Caudoviricetes sp.]
MFHRGMIYYITISAAKIRKTLNYSYKKII